MRPGPSPFEASLAPLRILHRRVDERHDADGVHGPRSSSAARRSTSASSPSAVSRSRGRSGGARRPWGAGAAAGGGRRCGGCRRHVRSDGPAAGSLAGRAGAHSRAGHRHGAGRRGLLGRILDSATDPAAGCRHALNAVGRPRSAPGGDLLCSSLGSWVMLACRRRWSPGGGRCRPCRCRREPSSRSATAGACGSGASPGRGPSRRYWSRAGGDDRRIHDRAGLQQQWPVPQHRMHRGKHWLGEPVLLQQMRKSERSGVQQLPGANATPRGKAGDAFESSTKMRASSSVSMSATAMGSPTPMPLPVGRSWSWKYMSGTHGAGGNHHDRADDHRSDLAHDAFNGVPWRTARRKFASKHRSCRRPWRTRP